MIAQNVPQLAAPPQLPMITQITNNTVCTEEYAGPYQFEVSIIPNSSKNNAWVYSAILNKVFIDMNIYFPVEFKISQPMNEVLFVRVTPVFSLQQFSQDLVFRCVQHEQPSANKSIPDHVRQHIIRCSNPNAQYFGDRHKNHRLYMLFPLGMPQKGTDAVREMFVFTCKNSCVTGMNRKPVEIVFALENQQGEVLGRRILNVRICSCPKRDKEKEEKDAQGSKSHGKKRKIDSGDKSDKKIEPKDKNIHTLTLEIAGKHNIQNVLKYCHDLMAGEIVRNPTCEMYRLCLRKLATQMRDNANGH